MKRNVASTIALIVSLGLAGATMAQGRHDEWPHGYDKTKAAATTTAKAAMPSGTGGRHDEKPHGVTKAKTMPTTTDAKTAAAPAAASGPATTEK